MTRSRGVSFDTQSRGVVATLVLAGALAGGALAVELVSVASDFEAGRLDTASGARAVQLTALHVGTLTFTLIGVFVLLSRHVTDGLVEATRNLTERVKSIGQGSFNERAPLEGPREIRELAHAVNGMAESLAWREQRLLHAERLSSIGTLVAGVAHEINNPLTWLKGNEELAVLDREELLANPDLPEAERARVESELESIRVNLEAVEQLASIAEALKNVSRGPTRDRVEVDVNQVVNGCLVVAHHKLKQGLDVVKELDATQRVRGDRGELSQVVLNLVLNAADAMAASGGRLTVTAWDEKEHVVIRVSDTGCGIPDHFKARLFEPFATTKSDGTGLGLALSRRIVESHGGNITCESTPGEGATFIVRLPAAAEAEEPGAANGALQGAGATG